MPFGRDTPNISKDDCFQGPVISKQALMRVLLVTYMELMMRMLMLLMNRKAFLILMM